MRVNLAESVGSFYRTHTPQIVSFTAPTGAGKTIIIKNSDAIARSQGKTTVKPIFDESCQQDEDLASEEEEEIGKAIRRYVVDINDVRCTILYPGMTLASVSKKYDIPQEKLLEFNETTSENDLKEGDIVFIEKKKTKFGGAKDFHHVKEGETIYGISQEYGIKMASLMKMNNIDLFTRLKEGDKLRLK